ncbi:NADP-dependent oxidoreductase [Vibrio coralliilyticus]|uniref:quinone oxidoreductase family protein n=2 Tax=Vibrio TaxID=662 RepID=UPI0005027A18|nr:NADP-dependent oxidoreductase [Vibrio coralliilyticus]KFI13405.1 hypothetical protein IX95_05515 [Vibrio sp. B183]NOI20512.1 NADP-dependent oxidoreductase [Vibrio coralliilyticus]
MKAAMIDRTGRPEVIKIVTQDKPEIPKNGLLIENHFSSVNPRDCLIRSGRYQLQPFIATPPLILGSDLAGIVIGVGQDVQGFSVGDRVFGMKNPSEGAGTNAGFVTVKAKNVVHLPESISLRQAGALPLVSLTAWQGLRLHEDLAELKGKRLLILGASGGVGIHALQIGLAAGAIVDTVTSPENLILMNALGSHQAFDYISKNFLNGGAEYDVIFDTVGKYSFDMLQHRLREIGDYTTTVPTLRFTAASLASKLRRSISQQHPKLSLVTVKPDSQTLTKIAYLVETRKLTPIIDSVFPIQELAKAHQRVQTQRTKGKVVISIRDNSMLSCVN